MPFLTSHEWFKHELDEHRRQWNCNLCNAKCSSASDMGFHLVSVHPGSTNARQREAMVKTLEKPLSNFVEGSCLLCDDWSPLGRLENNSNKFRSHLAKHFQVLACEAIPLTIEGLEIKDTIDEGDATLSEHDDDSETSVGASSQSLLFTGKFTGNGMLECVLPARDSGNIFRYTVLSEQDLASHLRDCHAEVATSEWVSIYVCQKCHQIPHGAQCDCSGSMGSIDV
ncbi:hypothetical protein BDP81DRAFT_10968 [Colletotrichum phormii]|uniref:C2H2-type domain-containing protein n=1 Tax=Colletotrichum phormii TaxID=359342 RepID=A0AAJ0A4P7_9PEZI|nr:uncharacterized protein BDP81DRAFT_10968 [Colletotrichum phormii]KAK1655853.1 hypothetical protein BDP81DRAFT_10968 [Colletotrichum phormii]